jgi:hypothetical protein
VNDGPDFVEIVQEDAAGMECPACGQITKSLKQYEFPQVVFVFLIFFHYTSYRKETVTACPSCLRRYLWVWGIRTLIPANFVWPVIVPPLFASRFLSSFRPKPFLGKRSLLKKIVGGVAIVGLALSSVAAFLLAAGLLIGPPEGRSEVLPILAGALVSVLVFTVICALADI